MRKGWPRPSGKDGRRKADDGKDNPKRAGKQRPDEEFLLPEHLLAADSGRRDGPKERNAIGSDECILLFTLKGVPHQGTTEKAISDLGLARRAFLHGYPSPAIRTHHAKEKKKSGTASRFLVAFAYFLSPREAMSFS